MATEEQKKENLVRGLKLIIGGLAMGLYDLFGEASFALMHPVGDELLGIMQKEMGLEIGGDSPKEVAAEIGRLFVDEFGWADKIEIVESDDDHLVVDVTNCKGFNLSKRLQDAGIKHPFTCPIMNVTSSAIAKVKGKRPHEFIEPKVAERGTRLTFKFS